MPKIAQRNANTAEQARIRELEVSQREERETDAETASLIGAQSAAQGASGLSAEIGSPLAVRRSTETLGRLDVLNIRNRHEAKAANYAGQRDNFLLQRDAKTYQASQVTAPSALSFAGGLGSLAANAYGKFRRNVMARIPTRRPSARSADAGGGISFGRGVSLN